MYDVVAIGELLVDFIQEDPTDTGFTALIREALPVIFWQ